MKKNKSSRNNAELYYKILCICAEESEISTGRIAKKLGISGSDVAFRKLEELKFLVYAEHSDCDIYITPQGFSTYLAISSQRQSAKQAKKATNIAIFAIWVSVFSLIISGFQIFGYKGGLITEALILLGGMLIFAIVATVVVTRN